MNYCTNMLKVIYIALFSFLLLPLKGQGLTQIISFADEQYKAGNFSSALVEYQRAIFYGKETNGILYQHMADCSFNLSKFEQAIELYDRAYFSYQTDSLKAMALLSKSKCNIITKNYNIALIDLLGITDSLPEKTYRLKQFYIGICYFGTEQFALARNYFIDAIHPSFPLQRTAIANIFDNKKLLYSPNPHTAFIMSLCFPGLGQFYAGDIKNGMNSLLLSAGLVYLGVNISLQQTVWDGIFTIMPWFQRYYQGGYMRAEKIAMEKRASNRDKVYKEVVNAITATK